VGGIITSKYGNQLLIAESSSSFQPLSRQGQ